MERTRLSSDENERQDKLPEASLILTSVRKEMKVGGVLQTRTFLAPFGCEEIKVVHGEEEDKSAGTLLIPRFHEEADNDEQGPSNSNKDKSEGDDGQGEEGEAVRLKNPCNKIKLVGKTTGHRQEEHPAWILTSSVILKTMRIRWKQLSQRMKAPRHWSLRQPLWK